MRTVTRLALAALLAASFSPPSTAERHDPDCATSPRLGELLAARDAAHMRRLERLDGASFAAKAAAVTVTRAGDIAILEADDSVVMPGNTFDLEGRAIRFMRRGPRFAVGREKPGLRRPIGRKIEISSNRTHEVRLPRKFTFPFGNEVYDRLWVNAHGNITLGEGAATYNPDPEDLLNGPPRIMPLLLPINPAGKNPNSGIYLKAGDDEIRVTWFHVSVFGGGNVTFQVRLRPDGRITYAYDKINVGDGLVGIVPGTRGVRVLDFNEELPAAARRGAVLEIFSDIPDINHPAITRAFLESFEDRYDYITAWFDIDTFPFLGFFHAGLRNDVQGIGRGDFDNASEWGSAPGGRLASYVFMNSLDNLPDDPDEPLGTGQRKVEQIFGHELGHRWLSFVRFRDPRNGATSDALRGRQLAHWNFNMDTDASVMEGNDIRDDGNGTFTTLDNFLTFSLLDQYLMGLVPAAAVPPFFLVEGPDNPSPATNPSSNGTGSGALAVEQGDGLLEHDQDGARSVTILVAAARTPLRRNPPRRC